jgi:hypothetical protein
MKTDALIDRLSEHAVPPRAAAATLAIGIGAGLLVSFAAMELWLGIRPDIVQAMATPGYWMKFFYTLFFASLAFWTLDRLARPGAHARKQAALAVLPFAAVALMGAMRISMAPEAARMPMMMGHSSHVCPWRIVVLALPVFAGTFWALRRLAPTRPVLSGLCAGLAAGAAGAFVYAFHCDESAAAFVALWYSFGIALVGLAGAAVGRIALRW